MSVSIVSVQVSSISSGLGISGPLAIVSMVGIWVGISVVSVVGIAVSVVSICKGMSVVSVVSISISGGLSSSRPLAIVVSVMVGIWVSIVTMVGKTIAIVAAIEVSGISTCFSLASSGGEHAQGNNSNGFHHLDAH